MSSAAGLGYIDGDEDYLPPPGPPPGWAAAVPVAEQLAPTPVEAQSVPTRVETPVGPPPGPPVESPVAVEIPPPAPLEDGPGAPIESPVAAEIPPPAPLEDAPAVPVQTPAEVPIEAAPVTKTAPEAPIETPQTLCTETAPSAPAEDPPAVPFETPEAAPPAPVEEPPAVPVETPEAVATQAAPVFSEIPIVAHVDTLRALSSETWPTPKPSATSVFMPEPLTAAPALPTIPVQAPPSPPTSVPSPKLGPQTWEDNELPSYQESFAAEFDRVISPEIVTTNFGYPINDSAVEVGSIDTKVDVEVQSNSEKRTVELRQSVKKKSLAAEQVEEGADDGSVHFTEGGASTYSPELVSEPVPRIPDHYAGQSDYDYPEAVPYDAEEEEEEEDQEPPPLPPRPLRTEILSRPIAIPALKNSFGSPYIRAYPIELDNLGIDRDIFFTFLDHLNRVTVKSPPLVAVSVIGTTMGFSPEPVTMIVGTVLDLSAQGTDYALSRGRSEVIIRDANRDIFNPVGLHVQVAKLDAVAKISDMPFIDEETGKIASGAQILTPLQELTDVHTLSAQERRIRALDEWLSPLNLEDVPEVEEPKNKFSKMQYRMSERNRRRGEESLMKSRKKARDRHTEAKQKALGKYEFELMELARKDHDTRIKAERNEVTREDMEAMLEERKEAARYEYEEELRKLELKYEKGDKERKGMKKINWLLITEKAMSDAQIDDGGENNPEKVAERAEMAEAGTLG